MDNETIYICPQCGADILDGACTHCGYIPNNDEPVRKKRNYEIYQESLNYPNNTLEEDDQNSYNNYDVYHETITSDNYKTPQKKSNVGIILAIVGGICLLLLIASPIIIAATAFNYAIDETISYTEEYDENDEYYEYDDGDEYDNYNEHDDYDEYDDFGEYDEEYSSDVYLDNVYWDDTSWKDEPENYLASDFQGEYYPGFCNCINENVSYTMRREFFEKLDKEHQVCIRVSYYQLDGDIPNIDRINQDIKDMACAYADEYIAYEEYYIQQYFEEYGNGYVIDVTSYITLNSEETISIVMNTCCESATNYEIDVKCANIDLVSGTLLYNDQIININQDFVNDFRSMSYGQNGRSRELSELSDGELLELFEDDNTLILFYTPCGMEVGIMYNDEDCYGWITVSIEDYTTYLKSI